MEARPVNPRAKGLEKATFRLTPELLARLRAEARRRAAESGKGVNDASQIVREALEAWLTKRR